MPVTINGNGTITGVSVGGLPDGIVDTDMLAANAVTDAKENLSGTAKAWANFDGTASSNHIRSSFNVSSITDEGTGEYQANFNNGFSNTNYCVVTGFNSYHWGSGDMRWPLAVRAINTGNAKFYCRQVSNGGSFVDTSYALFAVFAS